MPAASRSDPRVRVAGAGAAGELLERFNRECDEATPGPAWPADLIELGTGEDDRATRAVYESLASSNREKPPDGPVMSVYEREL
jgi:hypothetical protein